MNHLNKWLRIDPLLSWIGCFQLFPNHHGCDAQKNYSYILIHVIGKYHGNVSLLQVKCWNVYCLHAIRLDIQEQIAHSGRKQDRHSCFGCNVYHWKSGNFFSRMSSRKKIPRYRELKWEKNIAVIMFWREKQNTNDVQVVVMKVMTDKTY